MQEDAEDDGQQSDSGHTEEDNIKKHLDAKEPKSEDEDHELSEKKDRPPRFSTLFGGTPPPQIVERYIEQPKKKRSGVYIPLPIFIALAIILFFESTLLFAYTIIALDNNLPSGLFPVGSATSARLDACNCAQQPAINVAPKFFMGASQVANKAPDVQSTTTTSKTSTTSSTSKPTATGTAHTSVVVTVTPSHVAKTSVINLTVDENGSTVSPSKVTSFTTIPAPSGGSKKRASVQSALESIISAKSADGGKAAPTPTTLKAAKSPTKNAAASSLSAGGGMVCFGGSGAVGLVCPDGVGRGGGKV